MWSKDMESAEATPDISPDIAPDDGLGGGLDDARARPPVAHRPKKQILMIAGASVGLFLAVSLFSMVGNDAAPNEKASENLAQEIHTQTVQPANPIFLDQPIEEEPESHVAVPASLGSQALPGAPDTVIEVGPGGRSYESVGTGAVPASGAMSQEPATRSQDLRDRRVEAFQRAMGSNPIEETEAAQGIRQRRLGNDPGDSVKRPEPESYEAIMAEARQREEADAQRALQQAAMNQASVGPSSAQSAGSGTQEPYAPPARDAMSARAKEHLKASTVGVYVPKSNEPYAPEVTPPGPTE